MRPYLHLVGTCICISTSDHCPLHSHLIHHCLPTLWLAHNMETCQQTWLVRSRETMLLRALYLISFVEEGQRKALYLSLCKTTRHPPGWDQNTSRRGLANPIAMYFCIHLHFENGMDIPLTTSRLQLSGVLSNSADKEAHKRPAKSEQGSSKECFVVNTPCWI